MWYSPNDILQYNCVFNFIVGMRGGGKTFAFKETAIKNFLKNKSQFIYLRRYKTELQKISTFFEPDLVAKFPNHSFSVKGQKFYIDDELCGYAIPLTTSHKEKSTNYANVTLIGFDEFIVDQSSNYKYLPNEFDVFNNFYDTVDRNKDKTRVLFIGNAISEVNPYFSGLGFTPNRDKRFTKYIKDGETLAIIEMWSDVGIIEQRKNTRFGKLIAGTEYDAFSNNNKFYRDNGQFIDTKPNNAVFLFGVYINKQIYGVWQDRQYLNTYIQKDYKKRDLFCLKPVDQHDKSAYGCAIRYVDFKNQSMGRRLVKASNHQYLYYENQELKDLFMLSSKFFPF